MTKAVAIRVERGCLVVSDDRKKESSYFPTKEETDAMAHAKLDCKAVPVASFVPDEDGTVRLKQEGDELPSRIVVEVYLWANDDVPPNVFGGVSDQPEFFSAFPRRVFFERR